MAAVIESLQKVQKEAPQQLDFWGTIPKPVEVVVYQGYFGPMTLPNLDKVRAELPKMEFVGKASPPPIDIQGRRPALQEDVYVKSPIEPLALAGDQ